MMAPVPATSWNMSAARTMTGLLPDTVCVHVLVTGPATKPVDMLVDVASRVIAPAEDPAVSAVATRLSPAKMLFVAVGVLSVVTLYSLFGYSVVIPPSTFFTLFPI